MANEERQFFVLCNDNCKFEGMTKEQIIAAIAEATGVTPTHFNDAFITKIKEQNKNKPLKFWLGTTAEFNAIEEKENDCFYILTDENTSHEERIEELERAVARHNVVLSDETIPYGDVSSRPQGAIAVPHLLDYSVLKINGVLCSVYSTNQQTGAFKIYGMTNSGSNESSGTFGYQAIELSGTVINGVPTITANNSYKPLFEQDEEDDSTVKVLLYEYSQVKGIIGII